MDLFGIAASYPCHAAESLGDPPDRRISRKLCGYHDCERHDHRLFPCMTLRMPTPRSRPISFRQSRSSLRCRVCARRIRNWFFDFPTSASETISFFNESSLYPPNFVSLAPYFDAAIAVSPDVVGRSAEDDRSDHGLSTNTTFTADNFLVQIQKIVQAGQASSATYPKQVLRDLMTSFPRNSRRPPKLIRPN